MEIETKEIIIAMINKGLTTEADVLRVQKAMKEIEKTNKEILVELQKGE